jgi:hypothetical protein
MGGFPILSVMLLVPMLGAAACLFAARRPRAGSRSPRR